MSNMKFWPFLYKLTLINLEAISILLSQSLFILSITNIESLAIAYLSARMILEVRPPYKKYNRVDYPRISKIRVRNYKLKSKR